jgi:hypothetical protein
MFRCAGLPCVMRARAIREDREDMVVALIVRTVRIGQQKGQNIYCKDVNLNVFEEVGSGPGTALDGEYIEMGVR